MLDGLASSLSYHALKLFNAEYAHELGKKAMKRRWLATGPVKYGNFSLFGVPLDNPLGLAAGFDKNAELVDVAPSYGFSWVEVGSVTLKGGQGNPKPRLFRVEGHDLLNRMGLNGDEAAYVAHNIRMSKSPNFAVSVAKTHSPDIMGDDAIEDMVHSYSYLKHHGIYTVLNISCPNTIEGRTFEDERALRDLLKCIGIEGKGRPLLLKLSPLVIEDVDKLIRIVELGEACSVDGYVLCNTMPVEHPKYGKGGRSGSAVFEAALKSVKVIKLVVPDRVVIGCGGVFTAKELLAYLEVGADAVQVYNGFVRGPHAGPQFVRRVITDLEKLKGEKAT